MLRYRCLMMLSSWRATIRPKDSREKSHNWQSFSFKKTRFVHHQSKREGLDQPSIEFAPLAQDGVTVDQEALPLDIPLFTVPLLFSFDFRYLATSFSTALSTRDFSSGR